MSKDDKLARGLLKSGEEGTELAQVIFKLVIHQGEFEWKDGNELYEKLVEEFGDVLAAQSFVLDNAPKAFVKRAIARKKEKYDKYEKWFNEQETG